MVANSVLSLGKFFVPLPAQEPTVAHFRNGSGRKEWKVFKIEKSATKTIRTHFQSEHPKHWESACASLAIPQKNATGHAPVLDVEPFTRDGFMLRLMKFIAVDDQVRLQLSRFLTAPYP